MSLTKYDVYTKIINPSRGMVEVFLGSTYATTLKDAKLNVRSWFEKGEERIVRKAPPRQHPVPY